MSIEDIKKHFLKEMSPEDEMKQFILNTARELKLDTGDVILSRQLMVRTIHFNPVQKENLFKAIETLVDEGIFEIKGDAIALTEKGRSELYG